MVRLGPEYRGKLPPGAAEQNRQALASYRKAASMGVLTGVQILEGGCAASKSQTGAVYAINNVPSLPLVGCDRSPCCACCYSSVVKD